ncbi:MAG TPA: ATP-binding protein [Candidatus Sulfotelmatobacter sp.]|nr:ATP-binding protein [Candidatus Sulfotelmatobacter sp.]
MGLLRRHRWFAAAAGITLALACVSLLAHKSRGLTVFADLAGFALMGAAALAALINAFTRPGKERSFWALTSLGFLLWTMNQGAWCVWEIILRQSVPDPFLFDIILFFHTVPLTAAVAWRPDLISRPGRLFLSMLNLLMLFACWIFLYAFVIFPHQYVILNLPKYNWYYEVLYGIENAMLVVVLALAVWTSSAGWRRLYLHFLGAFTLYSVNSQFLDRAAADGRYYSGSFYDVFLLGSAAWVIAATLSARDWTLEPVKFTGDPRWKKLIPRLAMLAMLSLPVLGLWAVLFDQSPASSRAFRILAVLSAMILMGTFVFVRQYLQDQELVALLQESRRAYDTEKQIQNQLVQKEKLASLGNLVAGAARDINHPLNAIMSHSERLWAQEKLSDQQDALLRKIVNQASRTRDLIANLLSFAQQTPGHKTPVEIGMLIKRAIQMLESKRGPGKVALHLSVEPDFPRVHASANQLFQVFIEIIENAMDALDETTGGRLDITAHRVGAEVVLEFSDNGPGLRDPERVFDPFYTTKPVGKGTGLGLSAVYGVVQDHGGQIACRNKAEGGALFILKLPVTVAAAQGAGSSR